MVAHTAVDFISRLAGNRQPADAGAKKTDVEAAASHEGQIADRPVGKPLDNRPGIRSGKREARHFLTEIANTHTIFHMVVEPAHMPAAQIIGAHDPPCTVTPVEQRQIALQPTILAKRHGKPCPARCRQPGGKKPVHPAFGIRSGDLEAREAGDVEKAHIPANGPHSSPTMSKALERFSDGASLKPCGAK